MPAIQHIAFSCIDRIAQEKFYTDHFGFKRARVFMRDTPNEFVMLRLGNACIELFSTPPESHDKKGGEQPIGFKHFAFEVDDIEKKVKEFHDAGVETQDIIDCSKVAPGLTVCFLNDPEGNIIELMQGWQDEEQP